MISEIKKKQRIEHLDSLFLYVVELFDQNHGADGGNYQLSGNVFQTADTGKFVIDANFPVSCRKSNGLGGIICVEDHQHLGSGFTGNIAVDVECGHQRLLAGDGYHMGKNVIGGGEPEHRVCLPECNQTLVVFKSIPIGLFVQQIPLDGVDRIGRLEAVLHITALGIRLGAKHFLTGLHEGDALGHHVEYGTKFVHPYPVFEAMLRHGQRDPIHQGVVVMAGDVVDSLTGILAPGRKTTETGFQLLGHIGGTGDETKCIAEEGGASQRIPDGIVEIREAGGEVGVDLGSQIAFLGNIRGHGPAFAIEDHIGMPFMNLGYQIIDGINIQKTHQIEAKSINMVFICPVADGIHDVLMHHAPLGGSIIATAGAVGDNTVGDAAEIHGN